MRDCLIYKRGDLFHVFFLHATGCDGRCPQPQTAGDKRFFRIKRNRIFVGGNARFI